MDPINLPTSRDIEYFTSYEDLEVHELMLRDKVRNNAYRNAIMMNKNLFHDKIVLDVGAGTGILSIYCAQAGAKKVYAIEPTKIANIAKEIIKENNYEDVIEVINTKIEDFQFADHNETYNSKRIDIIVSEWMGFYLLHESMLDSVIYARDNFLKKNGLIFPETAILYVSPCSVPQRFDDWEDLDGVKMIKFVEKIRIKNAMKPEILAMSERNLLLKEGACIAWFDLNEINMSDIMNIKFNEIICVERSGQYQGLCIWFDCIFPHDADTDNPIILSTKPNDKHDEQTHWKQSVIVLPKQACESVDVGDPISFELTLNRSEVIARNYNIELTLQDPEEQEHPTPCNCVMTRCIIAKEHLMKMTSMEF